MLEVREAATPGFAARSHQRVAFESDEVAAQIYERICGVDGLIPDSLDGMVPIGCSRKMRLYRYGLGDEFGPHIDESNDGSKFTVLIYLNNLGPADGGRTLFYHDHAAKRVKAAVRPAEGMLLLHGHGHRCLTHEGEKLVRGVKYVLRTDVLYGHAHSKKRR